MQLSDRYRPVVAVDVDGVLRLRRGKAGRPDPPGAFVAEVTVFRYAYPTVFHSPPEWDDDGMSTGLHMFSGVGAAWLRSLLERDVEVVWATTWQHHANDYLAPVLAISRLPVAVRGDEEREWGPAEWKSVQLADGFGGVRCCGSMTCLRRGPGTSWMSFGSRETAPSPGCSGYVTRPSGSAWLMWARWTNG